MENVVEFQFQPVKLEIFAGPKTWMQFVRHRRGSVDSVDSLGTETTHGFRGANCCEAYP